MVLLTVAVIFSYYDSSPADVAVIAAIACGLTVAAANAEQMEVYSPRWP